MVDNDYPTTPIVTEHTKVDPERPYEFLFSDSELSEDESEGDLRHSEHEPEHVEDN